jgi:glycosyltransferase involved in cell wall biosynthesis
MAANRANVCWIGGTRYTRPLNPALDAKWAALAGLEAELFVVGFAASMRPRRFTQHAHFILLPLLPTPILRYAEMYLIAPLILLWLIFRRRVTVIIAQSPYEGLAGALAKQMARLFDRRVALAVESHGNFEVTVFGQRKVTLTGLYRRLMAFAARYAFRQADALRAVSNSTRQQLEEWSPGKPIEQFMAWIDASVFGYVEREVPLSAARDIVYAGVLTPLKNVHVLVEAFAAALDDAGDGHLWLVGRPENLAYVEQIEAQIERLDLKERVILVGGVSGRELVKYLARARALALVSSSEGLPRSIIEAMLAGLPVIASRVGGIPEIVADGEIGYLVPPGDVGALAAAIQALYRNTDIDAMGERARATAQQFFSTEAYVDGYRRLIAASLGTSSGRDNAAPLPREDRKTHTG